MQRRLHAGQTIQLPKLGTFSRSADGQIHFEQDRFFNLLLSSYGLANLNFIAVPKEEKEEAPIIHLDTTPTPSKVNWAKLAAAACFLPIAFYSVWIPTQTSALQSGLFSTSDFNPLHKQEAPAYQKTKLQLSVLAPSTASKLAFEQAPQTTFATYEWLPGHAVRVRIPAAPIQTASTQTIALNEQSAEPVQQAAYDFIVGCFSNLQNAQNLQRKLQRDGFAARLIQNGPLTKVSLGAAQNLSELQTLQQQASARGLQGWVLTN